MAIQTERAMTVAEYLDFEAGEGLKYEYIDGVIYEMTGGTGKHSRIKVNLMLALGGRVSLSESVLYNSDMRVKVGATRYVYPDLSLVRGDEIYEDESELTLLNPVFVVEVTSPTSSIYDRVDKLDFYFDVPSIEAYLVVDQDRPRADLYTRADEGWLLRIFNHDDDVIPLPMLDCELPLAQVYRGLVFEEA